LQHILLLQPVAKPSNGACGICTVLLTLRATLAPDASACLPRACLLHVQFLRSLDIPASWCETTTMAAAKGGQLACLAWLKAHSCPMDVAACIDAAAKHEHSEVLQYLLTECMW
jgi:hypothetical protein